MYVNLVYGKYKFRYIKKFKLKARKFVNKFNFSKFKRIGL